MNATLLIIGAVTASFLTQPTPAPPEEPSVEVVVEGVAPRPEAAPIAALGKTRERIFGLTFTVFDGKYVNLGEGSLITPLETRGKSLIGVDELKTGLFKARLKVQVPASLMTFQEKLGTRIVEGEGSLAAGGSLILARGQARLNALEKGILEAVAERYPKGSVPTYLEGRVVFLGTIREALEEGGYTLLARLKVELVET